MTTSRDIVTDMFKVMNDGFNATIKSGMKLQEDTTRFWNELIQKNTDAFAGRWEKLADDVVPFGRKNVERFQRAFEEQSTRTMDAIRHAFDVSPNVGMPEINEKMAQAWKSSFESFRTATETFAKANSEMLDTWNDVVRGGCCGTTAKPAAQKPAGK